MHRNFEFVSRIRFGGPSDYSDRKGWPAMKVRHIQFEIKPSDNKIWLDMMEKSLDEVLVGMRLVPLC
jgi:truncated hemoglobin YjbI